MAEATIEDLALQILLGGGTAPLSPFQRSPSASHGVLPPLLGRHKASCDQGWHTPLEPLKHRFSARCWSSREVDLRVCLSAASYAAADKTERRMALKI